MNTTEIPRTRKLCRYCGHPEANEQDWKDIEPGKGEELGLCWDGEICRHDPEVAIDRLNGELLVSQSIIAACLAAMPVGNLATHTPENLPGRIAEMARELAVQSLALETAEKAALARDQDQPPKEWLRHPDCAGFCGGQCTPSNCWAFACKQRMRGEHISQRDGAKGDGKGEFQENPIPSEHS